MSNESILLDDCACSSNQHTPPPPPPLAEWQQYTDADPVATSTDIQLNRQVLLDILTTTDAPWGHVASLTRQELIEYLQEQERERERGTYGGTNDRRSSLAMSPRHGRRRRRTKESSTTSTTVPMQQEPQQQRPFPLGPPPVWTRTNPANGRRQTVLQYNGVTQQYAFAAAAVAGATGQGRTTASPATDAPTRLYDQSYAQVMLRLHPLVFLTLYEYETTQGRMGRCHNTTDHCRRCNNSNNKKHHVHGSTMEDNMMTMDKDTTTAASRRYYSGDDMIHLGGVEVCSRALVCALARSYATKTYQQLSMEQILCHEPYCVCSNSSNASKISQCCTRHYVLMSYPEIQERRRRQQQEQPPQMRVAMECPTPNFTSDSSSSPDSSPSRSLSTHNNNNKSPDTLYTISTITTSASSEMVHHHHQHQRCKDYTNDGEEIKMKVANDNESPTAPPPNDGLYSHRKNLVDSSSSHPLRAPFRTNATTTDSVCGSQSQSTLLSGSTSLSSRPKSFWPGGDNDDYRTLVKQQPGVSLVEPVPVRAVSSESLLSMKFVMVPVNKSGSSNSSNKKSGSALGYSTTMAMSTSLTPSSSGGTSTVKAVVGMSVKTKNSSSPTMTMQLQWNSSSTTLPMSNLIGRRRSDTKVAIASGANDVTVEDAGGHSPHAQPVKERLVCQNSESSSIKSDADEIDTTVDSDIDSQATRCSIALMQSRRRLFDDSMESRISFEDLWQEVQMPMPTSPPRATRSSGTVKSGSSGIDSVATQCSSPVSVATIDIGELVG